MTDATSPAGAGSTAPPQSGRLAPEPTGWVGWIMFAGTMLLMIGMFHVIQGLVAIFDDGYYLVSESGLTVHLDYAAWGWAHVIGGIVVGLAGVGLYSGRMWARVVGIIVAVASMLANFAFIAAYPVWSVIVIALNVFVIFALTVHGREMQSL